MKKRFTEEQIIGFLREAEAGLPIKELCRQHGFSEASYYLWRSKFGVTTTLTCPAPVNTDTCSNVALAVDFTLPPVTLTVQPRG